ncbi:MAG: hypothetical protein O2944_05620 [Proteobacteria bacterium]|nr:hypothetical protein [Pseudomonadota bacterium]
MIPVAQPNDPSPLSKEEIAFATKSLREIGRGIVDQQPKAQAAQLLAKLNAALPAEGAVAAKGFDGLWRQAIGDDVPPMNAAGMTARQSIQECSASSATYQYGGLKRCLEFQHDDLIRDLNVDYWQNQPGS